MQNDRRPAMWAMMGIALLGASGLLAQHTGAQDAEPFSPGERAQLSSGALVRRNTSRREGGNTFVGGTSWQRVRAPIDRVWATVRDPSAYSRLIPSLDEARVVDERGETRIVRMHHTYGIGEAAYFVRMRVDDERHEMRFELDRSRPHDIRAGRGFLSLTSYRGDTIVAWGMLADVGAGFLQQLFGPFLNEWLLLPPRCVRDDVEPGRRSEC
jgi:hypothetical protein